MGKVLHNFMQLCVKCKRSVRRPTRSPTTRLSSPWLVSSTPFRVIAIDLYKPRSVTAEGFHYVLTVVDMCTRWVGFFPLKTKFAAEVFATLYTQWMHVHGVPELILSDRGKKFLGVVTSVCNIPTVPASPQGCGLHMVGQPCVLMVSRGLLMVADSTCVLTLFRVRTNLVEEVFFA